MPKPVGELSLDQLGELTQEYAIKITTKEYLLRVVSTPFREKGTILPAQCYKAISAIKETKECVGEFCEFLNNTSSQPPVFTALRFQLLNVLYLIENQATELVEMIDDFCATCMAPAQYVQRREISNAFQTLFQRVSAVVQQTAFLEEEAQRKDDYFDLLLMGVTQGSQP